MDKGAREALARRVTALSTADATEVLVLHDDSALTRFTHNTIHQNVAHADTVVSVRAIVDGRTGVARTNALDDGALRQVVDRSIEIAKLAPKDPLAAELPRGGPFQEPAAAYVPATAAATADLRASLAHDVFTVAESSQLWAAGFVTSSQSGITVANSTGLCASFDGTDAGMNVKMNGADSTGYAEAFDADVARIDARARAATAAQKADDSKAPDPVEPGEWTVILEPAAFGELFSNIVDHFSAQAVDEGSSFLSDGRDKPYMSEAVTISDDFAHPLAPGMPFDYEGQPTKRLTLVDGGVARAYVTDSYWARKLGCENTGHALPAPNAWGPMPRNPVISAGSKSTAQLISETKRGLLISRFWYIRTVDQRRTIVTGMTRDGTFLIENGKIVRGVRNMRFNQNIVEALRTCEFSNEQRRTGGYSYTAVVPAVKLERFRFSSGTEF